MGFSTFSVSSCFQHTGYADDHGWQESWSQAQPLSAFLKSDLTCLNKSQDYDLYFSLSTALCGLSHPAAAEPGQLRSFTPLANSPFILAQVFHFLLPQQETMDPQILGRVILPSLTAHSVLKSPQISPVTWTFFLHHKTNLLCQLP